MHGNDQSNTPQTTRELATFFLLAYALSWALGIPLALAKQGVIRPILPEWAHYFVAFGPLLSALIITSATRGQSGMKELLARMNQWRVSGRWWCVALSPLIVGFVAALFLNTLTPHKVSLTGVGEVHFLPPLGIGALFLWIFTFGIGEEVGWRGYALPRLQHHRTALHATVILAFFWGVWHLPQFFYLFDAAIVVGWAIGVLAGAIVFTWLLNSAGGSIPIVAVFHGCFNFISASSAGNGLLAAIVSTAVMVWAVGVVLLYKPKNLSSKDKFVV